MVKDPAFLFYPNDYMGGTMGMTFEEKGAYMDLLVLQFNKGAFTIDHAKKVLNGSFDRLWPIVIEKFVEQDGKFFNPRLEKEKERRKNFIDRQIENGKKGGRKPKQNPTLNPNDISGLSNIENENENTNETYSGKEKGMGKGKLKIDESLPILPNVLEAAEMNQWTLHQNRHTEFIKSQWGVFLKERNNDPPVKRMLYIRQPSELYQYFLNWIRNKKPVNGTYKKSSSKSSGAEQLLDSLKSDLGIND